MTTQFAIAVIVCVALIIVSVATLAVILTSGWSD
jgi:hypothetical protein